MPLEEGLPTTVDWMRANLDRIDACIRRHAGHMELPAELALA